MSKNGGLKLFYVLKRILPLAFLTCPFYIIISLMSGVLHGILNGMVTLYSQKFFNTLSSFNNSNIYFKEITYGLISLATIIILVHIFTAIHNATIEDISFRIMRNMYQKLNEKAVDLSPIYFESSKNLNMLIKAKEGVVHGTFFVNVFFTIFTYYIPYFIFMSIYLITLKPLLIVSIILVFIPVVLSQIIRGKYYIKLSDYSAGYLRKFKHYEECLIGKKFFKETRMLGAYSFFYDLYNKNIDAYNKEKYDVVKKSCTIEITTKSITLFGYLGILVLFIYELINKEITVAAFVAVFTSINTMFTIMEELLCKHIGSLSEKYGNIKNYVEFWDYTEDIIKGGQESNGRYDIDIENASFRYPECTDSVIKNINLHINDGEFVAIVGENGAGKTTLAKLLSGIYYPCDGNVKIGGISTVELKREKLMQTVSAVFQKYQKYALRLSDNIYISDTLKDKDEDKIDDILRKLGFSRQTMININETDPVLAKEFGGTELSGGQWQKIAIARGVYKESRIIILDEPTASIDPIEENRLYEMFRKLAKGKTTILITHRLGAAKLADRIIVVNNGKIEQMGAHDELINTDGVYAQMCKMQKEMYIWR